MVSKVAVIALVAIISVPILLGYAMNLTETTETDYKITGDSLNVTSLLLNDVEYTTTHADIYELNTNTRMAGIKSYPIYENLTSASSPLYSRQFFTPIIDDYVYDMWNYYNFRTNIEDSTSTSYLKVSVYYVDPDNTQHSYGSYTNVINISYNDLTKTLNMAYILTSSPYSSVRTMTYTNDQIRIIPDFIGGWTNTSATTWGYPKTDTPSNNPGYVDFSAGFRLLNHNQSVNQPYVWTEWPAGNLIFPSNTKSVLLTMDLDSITDPSYSVLIGNPYYYLNKTTTGGVVSWQIVDYYDPTNTVDLYYNQSGGNTYQIYLYADPEGTPTGTPGYYDYTFHHEYRYVGNWPDLIGAADYYLTFDFTYQATDDRIPGFGGLGFEAQTTPILRVDDAEYAAFTYQVIYNQTYDPVVFKNNPATTVSVDKAGSSIVFGGNTYTVTKGNINLSGHDVPVNGLVFSSFDNGDGTYTNRIGNTVVSTTAAASTITFNGSWSANVSTQSIESYTYSKTQWNAGSFAWDGIDQNFLMVGLLTCLGVFIALGIYARKRGTGGLIPLMIVVGGAAMLFFVML